jgi:hypothetical protein
MPQEHDCNYQHHEKGRQIGIEVGFMPGFSPMRHRCNVSNSQGAVRLLLYGLTYPPSAGRKYLQAVLLRRN